MNRLTLWSVLCLLGLLLGRQAAAIDDIQISIGHWGYEALAASGFDVQLGLTGSGISLDAHATRLEVPTPIDRLDNVSLHCDELRFRSGRIQCDSGSFSFQHAQLGSQNVAFSLQSQPESGHYHLDLTGLQLAGGSLTVTATLQNVDWTAQIQADTVALEALIPWLSPWLTQAQQSMLTEWDVAGSMDVKASLKGHEQQLAQLQLQLQGRELSFSNSAGDIVGEALALDWHVDALQEAQHWLWQSRLRTDSGQSYVEPVFLDFAANPVDVDAAGRWGAQTQTLTVEQISLEQQAVLAASAQLTVQDNSLNHLELHLEPAELAALYPVWLQPFLLGNAAGKLDATGRVALDFKLANGDYQLQLVADEVSVVDQQQRFSMSGLNGRVGWTNADIMLDTAVSWQQARIYAVPLGAAEVNAQSRAGGLVLQDSLNLPVLDGELVVSAFSLQQNDDQRVDWTFEGLLTPVSMDALSEALDWPPLHGKLSGVIPRVSYSKQQIGIDGALQLKLFDGVTVIRDLRMTTPLGAIPQLYANIDVDNIDLELLTRTFDFGRISGRLDGQVHNLRLANWKPVRFDAYFATPAHAPGKRRISQKAVDNLTEIGGGAAGALSRSFLRFFDDFAYQRIGISCKLRNEVCEMAGVEEAEQGYYIVKGGGGLPPWINVVGYTRRVDWTDLIERLKAVSESSGPVIE